MKPRLVYIVTHPLTAHALLKGQLSFMQTNGFETVLITSPDQSLEEIRERENVRIETVAMEREISPIQDLISLFRLYRIIRKLKPDIVNAGTPKAGLLGMIASFAARVPVRIYVLRGLRLETTKGWTRIILSLTERVAASCAHRVICVSESLRKAYLMHGLSDPAKTLVVGSGSSNGVDVERFSASLARKEETAKELGLTSGLNVIGFVGRLTRDKGIRELLEAFRLVSEPFPGLRLLIMGEAEPGDPLEDNVIDQIRTDPRIIHTGFVTDTARYYAVMDLLVLPSYREGFPNAPLEAAAAGIPTVGFRVTGTMDAVDDGVTGKLVTAGDSNALAGAIRFYLENPEHRIAHGRAARDRVFQEFRNEMVWNNLKQVFHVTHCTH